MERNHIKGYWWSGPKLRRYWTRPEAIQYEKGIKGIDYRADAIKEISKDLDEICVSGADEAFGGLDLVDLNVVLHRADGEEKDATGELSL